MLLSSQAHVLAQSQPDSVTEQRDDLAGLGELQMVSSRE
jgi:hypothetical protein